MTIDDRATSLLQNAWADLVKSLEAARATLTDPECHPPVANDRNLAEGYRYLFGQLHRMIETELHQNPEFPYFQRHPWTISKYTIENPDNMYLYAPLDPSRTYKITGRAYDHSHWRSERASAQRLAPHYVLFEAHSVAPGDSGRVEEIFDGTRVMTGMLDSTAMDVDDDGTFEIVLAANRPDGYKGNFISTVMERKDKPPAGATKLYVREIFGDWDREHPLDMRIVCVGNEGRHPAVRTAEQTAHQIKNLGERLYGNLRFWSSFYGFLLDPWERAPNKGPFHLNKNDILKPRQAGLSTGGGQATNFFGGGLFDLDDNEALIAEVTLPQEPVYTGMHLSDFWGQSLDYEHRQSSLNHLQAHRDDDGVLRYVIARTDPGVPNWLDTVGYDSGYITLRTTFVDVPAGERQPTVACKVVPLDGVREALPQNTPRVDGEARAEAIARRQAHVARRYRQY